MEQVPVGHLEAEFDQLVGEGQKIHVLADIAARKRATEAAREHRFRDLLNALPAAIYTTDAAGRITYFNEAAADMWGVRPELGTTEWCGSWKLYWPDGTPLPHDQCPMAQALKENRPIRGAEAIAERPDGRRVPFIPYPTPLCDEAGILVGAINMLVDITERKKSEEQQALLIRELHHRVKNTLATVQAIMSSTARTSTSIEEFQNAFVGRISALARIHLLLTENLLQTANFEDLLRNELAIYDDSAGGRIRLRGPAIELTSEIAVPLGMAIHELTTNAAKHGALSLMGGTVEVGWRMSIEADGRKLGFQWIEQNGPPVAAPEREGFGSRLLQKVLRAQTHAEVTVDYDPAGLRVSVVLPLRSNGPI
jgi:PAS domain S-box-containing protein